MTPKQLKQLMNVLRPATSASMRRALRHYQRSKADGKHAFNFERWLRQFQSGSEPH